MFVRLTNFQSEVQKPFLELVGQPWAPSKTTDEKCELLLDGQRQRQSLISPKYTNRTDRKLFAEVIPDSDHGGLNGGFKKLGNQRAVCVRVLVAAC